MTSSVGQPKIVWFLHALFIVIVLTNETNLYELWSLNAIAKYKSKISFKLYFRVTY